MRRLRLAVVLAVFLVAASALLPKVASAATDDGVPGLELCGSLPQSRCDLGPILDHFPDYRSVCFNDDCSFISAADWDEVGAGVTPSPATVESEYKAAGLIFVSGISMNALWPYWESSGIDSVYLASYTSVSKDESSIESTVLTKRAVIVDDFSALSSFIGLSKFGAGTKIMIVDGYTPKGPLVVYQGVTIQMTWAQWNAQVRSVWQVAASKNPPVSTPPTSSSAPTATLSLSSNTITSAGGIVTLTYSSDNATSCTLTSSPSIWTTATAPAGCNGTYEDDVPSTTTAQEWTFTFAADNSDGQSATSSQTLVQSAPTALTPQFDNPSPNWSGYVVPSSSDLVTYAEGEWTVPTMNCADTPNGDVSSWVGIGGTSSTVLLQTGVTTNCVDGIQQTYGWWEEYPSVPNTSRAFTGFPVAAGNEMEAIVAQDTDGSWSTTLIDLTTGLTGIMVTGEAWGIEETGASSFTTQGSTTGLSYSGGYTAEWIVEDPGVINEAPGNVQPFANFGSITFSNMRTSLSSWYLTPSEEWGIVQDGETLAAPTNTTADGFTDTYTGP